MPPYTQYTPFSPYENVLSNFRFCNSPLFPLLKLHPLFPNLFAAFRFLQCKNQNAILKRFNSRRFCNLYWEQSRNFSDLISAVPNKGCYLRREKAFGGKILFPLLNLSRCSLKGEDGTPHLFSKPFCGAVAKPEI